MAATAPSGMMDEWWFEIFHSPFSYAYTKEYRPWTLDPSAKVNS